MRMVIESYRSRKSVVWMIVGLLAILLIFLLASRLSGDTETAGDKTDNVAQILSHRDGIFCAGEYEGAAPYVEVGSEVAPGTLVAKIRARMPHEVRAGMFGTVTEVLAHDGQMVYRGQPLFEIELKPDKPR